jgi:hypothetical protein
MFSKKGRCEGMKCGCHKNGKPCGPGCRCQGCTNIPVANQELHTNSVDGGNNESEDESSSDESNSEQSEDEQLEMETEMVTEDFDHLVVDLPP